jgi:hypothetical protein
MLANLIPPSSSFPLPVSKFKNIRRKRKLRKCPFIKNDKNKVRCMLMGENWFVSHDFLVQKMESRHI